MIGRSTSTHHLSRPPLSAEVGRWLGDDRVVIAVAAVIVTAAVFGLFNLTWAVTVGLVGPILVLGAMVAIGAALIHSTAQVSDIPNFTRLAVFGALAKVAGTLGRYFVSTSVYESGDYVTYHESAVVLAGRIQMGAWSLDATPVEPYGSNTHSIAWLLGSVYSVVGTTWFMGFAVFSWFSWVGLMLIYRAFRTALPDVDSKVVALLLFFLPSMMYWPSIMGKEAFMLLCMALPITGVARFIAGRGVGLSVALIVVGLAGLVWVRPHMALIMIAATIPAMVVRAPSRGGRRRQFGRIVMLGLLSVILILVMGNVQAFFGGTGDWYAKGTTQVENQSRQGGSAFEPRPVSSPVDLPVAAVNVILRPLPWQASGITGLVASAEGLFLIGLVVWRWRLIPQLPRTLYTRPMVAFAFAYAVLFIVAFSNVGNAGILARQRTQMLPFLVLALCVAAADAYHPDRRAARRR